MQLGFYGANRGVTGSCHYLHCAGKKILIDCGMYQGGRELEVDNNLPFGFEPSEIDFVLLTHAHLDHCGRLPLLAKRGFRGEIIATAATRELARIIMLDAAHLEEEEARYQSRKAARRSNHPRPIEPLYTTLDALNTLDCFGRTAKYNQLMTLAPGIRVMFVDAGHILGSASVIVFGEEVDGQKRSVAFSGDIGNRGRPLLREPVVPPKVDVVVMETTYGDRLHKSLQPSIDELYDAINDTFRRGGNVIVPTFALERAQEVLFYLREGLEQHKLPGSMQVFLDSPMAISATKIYQRHTDCYDEHTAKLFVAGRDPFALPGLHFVHESAASIALNRIAGGAVIMAGSGMCTGGRVRHHLKHNLWRNESSVVFVGFAAEGTLARKIIDGAQQVMIFGEEIPVRAKIYTINGFSAHADRDELLQWHQRIQPLRTFLVHGEQQVMQTFAKQLHGHDVVMPQRGETFEI